MERETRPRLELGLDTFGDVTQDSEGNLLSHAQVIRNLVEEGVLADELGLDFFGVGEHHRDDFAVSAPEVVLAAIAARTKDIRLGSAVTVLSSDDPVRVYQRFATVDAISGGRAEIILGRGSFTESFPLFGYELSDYEVLFEEKLALMAELVKEGPVNWSGTTRSALVDQHVYPTAESAPIRTWVGVGGSPQSVVRTASHGMPLMLAIIGGQPRRFAPMVDLYHRATEEFDRPRGLVGAHSPGHIAATDEEARDQYFPHYQAMMARIGAERGWRPMSRYEFDVTAGPEGALFVGSPETVADKIVRTTRTLGLDRFDLKYSAGTLPHELSMESIRLYGTEVAPLVRERLAAEPEEEATPVAVG